jgi:hypothetical protein
LPTQLPKQTLVTSNPKIKLFHRLQKKMKQAAKLKKKTTARIL